MEWKLKSEKLTFEKKAKLYAFNQVYISSDKVIVLNC